MHGGRERLTARTVGHSEEAPEGLPQLVEKGRHRAQWQVLSPPPPAPHSPLVLLSWCWGLQPGFWALGSLRLGLTMEVGAREHLSHPQSPRGCNLGA